MKSKDLADPTAESRKQDHIELAFQSQVKRNQVDPRFSYEPLMAPHPDEDYDLSTHILGKTLRTPIWVSSMTGGTEMATRINHNLARACGEFGMGMGLGSCRSLLYDDARLGDFDVKHLMPNQPLFANLGVAQLEELIDEHQFDRVEKMIDLLKADGLIIHVNPMQEWLQPEGDRYKRSSLETIQYTLEHLDRDIIVKEVGQGMGRASLKALMQLPLQAIDFAASGGTNFALLELLRAQPEMMEAFGGFTKIGHDAKEMTLLFNELLEELGDQALCKHIIISGGVNGFLDGYYYTQLANSTAIYGQASAFLKQAMGDYEALQTYIIKQRKGLQMAHSFLRIKS